KVSDAASAAVCTLEVTGFQPFKVTVEVDDAGKIVSVSVPEHSETPGFGADLIADAAVFDALVGQDIATAQIDVKAGVTLTSNAINDALAQAAKEVQ
ncbi:MAG: FMN-binding protein, partial [Clostridia bacterium]|nr:FMN-binding protein [Clostridia bacterium]